VFTTFAVAGNGASAGDVGIELDTTTAAYIQNILASADFNCNFDALSDLFAPVNVKGESKAQSASLKAELLIRARRAPGLR
jgi:hypothetical protein